MKYLFFFITILYKDYVQGTLMSSFYINFQTLRYLY